MDINNEVELKTIVDDYKELKNTLENNNISFKDILSIPNYENFDKVFEEVKNSDEKFKNLKVEDIFNDDMIFILSLLNLIFIGVDNE